MKTLRYLLALMLLPSIVFAADLKITQMPAASSVAASDLVNVVQGSASRKATVGQIALGGVGYAANAGTVANTIPVRNGSGKVPGSITGDADTVDGLHAADFATAAQGLTADRAAPSGTVIAFAGSSCPTGWLAANGTAVSRATYAVLYGIIGTTYGTGDGTTTYNLPDLRGEFIRGLDGGRGIDTGRALGSYQADAFKSHNHAVADYAGTSSMSYRVNAGVAAGESGALTSSTGGTETRPRNIALPYCIKP